jgi:Protein of unknown function (DUF2971)
LLYHYTTLAGLTGILEARSIWCSHITALNDPDEKFYGQELVTNKLIQVISSESDPIVKEFLDGILINVKYFNEKFYHTYVACFCERDNILSQWQSYANSGGGYSLGFNFNSHTKFSHDCDNILNESSLSPRRIIYDIDLQNKILSDCLDSLILGARNALQKFGDKTSTILGWTSRYRSFKYLF